MDTSPPPTHPVLRSLAVLRAARDFGLPAEAAEALARRYPAASGCTDALAAAAADVLLQGRWAHTG